MPVLLSFTLAVSLSTELSPRSQNNRLLDAIAQHLFINTGVYCLVDCRCTQIKTYSWDNAQVILVGNKCDMEDERVIAAEKGKTLADQLGKTFILKPGQAFVSLILHFPPLYCL